jgi:Flp pilus assembly CpaF family ATPase
MPRRNRNSGQEPINRDRLIDDAARLQAALVTCNILIGGIPGSGKSAALTRYLARAIKPGDLVWVTDAKQPIPELIPRRGEV